jgi:general stress protein 26
MTNHSHQESVEKLGKLIKDIKFAMMTTIDAGRLRSRPMVNQQAEFDGDLWFFTQLGSPKVAEIQRDSRVNIAFAKPEDQEYVSVSGTAEVVRDREKAKELWNPFLKAWFPKGLEDPDLALLRVRVEEAEYWDSPSSAMVQLFGAAKAALTGKRSEGSPTENEKVTLTGR